MRYEYDVVTATTVIQLTLWVQERCERGWRPTGGVSAIAIGVKKLLFLQAVVIERPVMPT